MLDIVAPTALFTARQSLDTSAFQGRAAKPWNEGGFSLQSKLYTKYGCFSFLSAAGVLSKTTKYALGRLLND